MQYPDVPPPPAAHVMRLACDEAQARAISDVLTDMLDPLDTAVAAFEAESSTAHWNSVAWMVEVYFGHAPDHQQVREIVSLAVSADIAATATFGRIAQRDWVASSLQGLTAVRAGRFVIHGSHDREAPRANEIGLEIEAALAFGTGHHGTTRGCLLMLDRVLKRRRPRAVLDVGTGTGVLAIAVAKALKLPVASGDIDPVSVAAARANAQFNGAGAFVVPVVARGLEHADLRGVRRFDLAFANILARPLRLLAPALCAAMSDDGQIVLSGLLARDSPGTISAYAAQGFHLVRRIDLEGWATLLLQR